MTMRMRHATMTMMMTTETDDATSHYHYHKEALPLTIPNAANTERRERPGVLAAVAVSCMRALPAADPDHYITITTTPPCSEPSLAPHPHHTHA